MKEIFIQINFKENFYSLNEVLAEQTVQMFLQHIAYSGQLENWIPSGSTL